VDRKPLRTESSQIFQDRQQQQQHPDAAAAFLGSAGPMSCDCEINRLHGGRASSREWILGGLRTDEEAERSESARHKQTVTRRRRRRVNSRNINDWQAEPPASVVNEPG